MTVAPLFWMVSMSLKESSEVFATNLIPHRPTFANFVYVFTQVNFIRYLWNTFFVSAVVTVVALFFHSMAGYALARLRFPGRDAIFLSMFATFLISQPVIIVPLFILARCSGSAGQLRGSDRPLDLQRLRHFPLAPVLSRRAARARGSGPDRRGGIFPHLLVDRPAAEPADPLGARHPVFPRELEFVPLAADDHQQSGPLDGAGGDRKLPSAVQRLVELHHGRLDRGRAADASRCSSSSRSESSSRSRRAASSDEQDEGSRRR